ncbi:hypothetical protein [Candidatus Nitronereus thalassa]|jgi:hypothetical protein|uniref:Uncharacterized protein n=1 Tax=Candidatus Nitronereus thalassa TaxID=3020898 RepID=A0ABU3K978_9BACT|nr:hypothetical protein [Candidatus Nitronereus thalassa]MDT7042917.1 hypothetical protein [Candidatus Nitronereus thalassa]GJL80208.1 MAG: hypothetical protein NPINA01_31970 [Nitrospinaceae bacterium]
MSEKPRIPKKGAGRKWAEKLKKLGRQWPPQGLVDKINRDDKKKVASPPPAPKDLEA